jgi:predicted outer membrane repeat protein
VLYAYPHGTSTSATCPRTSNTAKECSLGRALIDAVAGQTIALAVTGRSGSSTHYIGNFVLPTAQTSDQAPVTIRPARHIRHPILDGNLGNSTGCPTPTCNGSILTIDVNVHAVIEGITFEHARNSAAMDGGAIAGPGAGSLTIVRSRFDDDSADVGGAIAAGNAMAGTLRVNSSVFTNNAATDGGAIEFGGTGGTGALTVTRSTFAKNTAGAGAAIEFATAGAGTATISRSTFDQNQATGNGGAIDASDNGTGVATIVDSTFAKNSAGFDGGAIDNGDNNGMGTVHILASTFSGNTANHGPAFDSGDNGPGTGNVVVTGGDVLADLCVHFGALNDQGFNAATSNGCVVAGAPHEKVSPHAADLGRLRHNGGPTETIALRATNPAVHLIPAHTTITAGTPFRLCPTKDQRGVRSKPGKCDAGAVQLVGR